MGNFIAGVARGVITLVLAGTVLDYISLKSEQKAREAKDGRNGEHARGYRRDFAS